MLVEKEPRVDFRAADLHLADVSILKQADRSPHTGKRVFDEVRVAVPVSGDAQGRVREACPQSEFQAFAVLGRQFRIGYRCVSISQVHERLVRFREIRGAVAFGVLAEHGPGCVDVVQDSQAQGNRAFVDRLDRETVAADLTGAIQRRVRHGLHAVAVVTRPRDQGQTAISEDNFILQVYPGARSGRVGNGLVRKHFRRRERICRNSAGGLTGSQFLVAAMAGPLRIGFLEIGAVGKRMRQRSCRDRLAKVQIDRRGLLVEIKGGFPAGAGAAIRAGIPWIEKRIARARLLGVLGRIRVLLVQVEFKVVEQRQPGLPLVTHADAKPFGVVQSQGAGYRPVDLGIQLRFDLVHEVVHAESQLLVGRHVPVKLQQQAVGPAVLRIQTAGAIHLMFRELPVGVLGHQTHIAELGRGCESAAVLRIRICGGSAEIESSAIPFQVIAGLLAGQNDRPADGVGTVQGRSGAANQLHGLDVVGVYVVPAIGGRAGVIDVIAADAIENRQHAVAADASNAETLMAAPGGGADRNTRLEANQIVEVLRQLSFHVLGGNHRDGPRNVFDRAWKPRGVDNQLFELATTFLPRSGRRQRHSEDCGQQGSRNCRPLTRLRLPRDQFPAVHDLLHPRQSAGPEPSQASPVPQGNKGFDFPFRQVFRPKGTNIEESLPYVNANDKDLHYK